MVIFSSFPRLDRRWSTAQAAAAAVVPVAQVGTPMARTPGGRSGTIATLPIRFRDLKGKIDES